MVVISFTAANSCPGSEILPDHLFLQSAPVHREPDVFPAAFFVPALSLFLLPRLFGKPPLNLLIDTGYSFHLFRANFGTYLPVFLGGKVAT